MHPQSWFVIHQKVNCNSDEEDYVEDDDDYGDNKEDDD